MKWKGRRQSKNVVDRTKEKLDLDKIPEDAEWIGGAKPAKLAKKDQEKHARRSDHLFDKTPIAKQKNTVNDVVVGFMGNPGRGDNGADIRGMNLKEGHRPQRIQVTPGAWKTNRLKKKN